MQELKLSPMITLYGMRSETFIINDSAPQPAPVSENIALNKPVLQSSYHGSRDESDGLALVDGNIGSYVHTECQFESPWVEIDLQGEYV
eukprot:Awhi_evm1s9775